MSNFLPTLTSKAQVDEAIQNTIDKVIVLRFGHASDPTTMDLDDTLRKCERSLANMASIFLVDPDAVSVYTSFFDITLLPSVVFLFNAEHMKVDFGTQDHTKWIGAFACRQDFIDLVEVIFRGAMKGKYLVDSPIPKSRTPAYNLIYGGI